MDATTYKREKTMMGKKKNKSNNISTVIGNETTITGDVNFVGGLHLDGSIVGNLTGKADSVSQLTVSENGVIEGDIRVSNLLLNGTVIGDVYVDERVELAAKARVTGTVYYRLLEMAMGAEVNGQMVHTEDSQRMLEYDGEESES